MFASIQQDLGPWRARGGISQLDLNTAVLASSGPAGDWLRITISDGKMYAKNFGTGKDNVSQLNSYWPRLTYLIRLGNARWDDDDSFIGAYEQV